MSKSLEDFYAEMCQSYQNETQNPVYGDSDTGIKLRAVAGQLHAIDTAIDFLERQMSADTAAGSALDNFASERGIKRRAGAKASGSVTFTLPSALWYSLQIPAGTFCTTAAQNGPRLLTTQDVSIEIGSLSADAPVEAAAEGYAGNLFAGDITQIIDTPLAGLMVENTQNTEGGADSESDESLRGRILESYKSLSVSYNSGFYRDLALSFEGVGTCYVSPRARGRGTVDIYVGGHASPLPPETIAAIQARIDTEKEINVDAHVIGCTVTDTEIKLTVVNKEGYNFEPVAAAVKEAVKSYLQTHKLGESLRVAAITAAAFNAEGVHNVKVVLPAADVWFGFDSIPRFTSITVTDGYN